MSQYWEQLSRGTVAAGLEIGPITPSLPAEFPAAEATLPASPSLPISANPWSVPDSLFAQLARLAQQPYSAYWAQNTISHLQALLQAERYEGDQTAAVLAALSHSADVANQLAAQAGDDRMRVELLRAHWALARRLDCWTVMNDIRVAAVDHTRVATNGPLDSLLHDVAQRSDLDSLGAAAGRVRADA